MSHFDCASPNQQVDQYKQVVRGSDRKPGAEGEKARAQKA